MLLTQMFRFVLFFICRDQLIQQLEKSQDMLMNFQQELNATEQELQRQREENKRYVKLALAVDYTVHSCFVLISGNYFRIHV